MSLPISYLQSILHNDKSELDDYRFFPEQLRTSKYLIELSNGEIVTINQLTKFYEAYSKGYRFIPEERANEISNDLDNLIKENKKVERKPKEESKVSSKQEVETVCAPTEHKPKRKGRNNKVKAPEV